jgi:hypothetical protein
MDGKTQTKNLNVVSLIDKKYCEKFGSSCSSTSGGAVAREAKSYGFGSHRGNSIFCMCFLFVKIPYAKTSPIFDHFPQKNFVATLLPTISTLNCRGLLQSVTNVGG